MIGVYKCATALPATPNPSPIVYVGNCGNQGDSVPDSNCGVMGNATVAGTSISLEDIADGDGTATTLLFGEKSLGDDFNLQKRWDYVPPSPPVYDLAVNNNFDTALGFVFGDAGFGLPATAVPVWKPLSPVYNLRSPHTGGSVVAFCDGHTYFLKNDINPDVYTQLVTSNNGRLPSGHAYKRSFLNEGSY